MPVKYYNGTSWVTYAPKYYSGAAWIEPVVKYWNGSSWVTVHENYPYGSVSLALTNQSDVYGGGSLRYYLFRNGDASIFDFTHTYITGEWVSSGAFATCGDGFEVQVVTVTLDPEVTASTNAAIGSGNWTTINTDLYWQAATNDEGAFFDWIFDVTIREIANTANSVTARISLGVEDVP